MRLWTKREESLLGADSDEKIAARLSRTVGAVRFKRAEFGIPSPSTKRRPWTPAELGQLGACPDRETAARLGRTEAEVIYQRNILGIKKKWGPNGSSKKRWSKKELGLLGKITDAEKPNVLIVRSPLFECGVSRMEFPIPSLPYDVGKKSGPLVAVLFRQRNEREGWP